MTAKHAPTFADARPPAAPPRDAESAVPRARRRLEIPPMPARLAEAEAEVPLQVRIPVSLHRAFKVEVMTHGETMTEVVAQLLTMYVEAPEAIRLAVQEADAAGKSLGAHLADRVAAAG